MFVDASRRGAAAARAFARPARARPLSSAPPPSANRRDGGCAVPVGGPFKRAFDVIAAGSALVLLSPVFALVAILIRLADPGGPVFFAHTRVGHGGRPFRCLKFRTMVVDAAAVLERHLADDPEAAREWEETRKLKDDPRVFPVGRFLRRSSLDELPQLVNILRGDMSVVGPRPVTADELCLYGRSAERYLAARPGLTGLWQISGRNDTSYRARVHLDSRYVRSWSFSRDLFIITRTVPAVMRARGSY